MPLRRWIGHLLLRIEQNAAPERLAPFIQCREGLSQVPAEGLRGERIHSRHGNPRLAEPCEEGVPGRVHTLVRGPWQDLLLEETELAVGDLREVDGEPAHCGELLGAD